MTFNQKFFLEDFSQVPFSVTYVFGDIDDLYWCWEKPYNQVLDVHAPFISFKHRPYMGSQFITQEIRRRIRQQHKNTIKQEIRLTGKSIVSCKIGSSPSGGMP